MPIYTYQCESCGLTQDIRVSVKARDRVWSCGCGGEARRVFTPTANIFVHDHFRVLQSDLLPEKGNKAWEHLQTGSGSQVHTPKTESFREHFDRVYTGDL